jgi:hypothetical protein
MRSPCSLYVYPPYNFCYKAYEITLVFVCFSVCLCIPLNFFVSCAVLIISEESKGLVLPRTPYFILFLFEDCCLLEYGGL